MGMALVVEVGADHLQVNGRKTTSGAGHRVVVPPDVWAGRGETKCGAEALEAGLLEPDGLVGAWPRRLGDPVPFHTDAGPFTSVDLFRRALEAPVAEVVRELGSEAGEVTVGVVVPDGWAAAGVRTVQDAVADVVGPALGDVQVRPVSRVRALRQVICPDEDDGSGGDDGPGGDDDVQEPAQASGPGAGVLVLDLGAASVQAQVLCPEPGTPGQLIQEEGLGGDLLDERVFRHVLDQVPAGRRAERGTPEAHLELRRTRTACREARESLSRVTETTVPVRLASASSELRLVRPELESLLEDDLRRILDVGQRAVDSWGAGIARVVLVGGCAHTPRVVQLASDRWSVPVDRPDEPQGALAQGALEILSVVPAAAAAGSEAVVAPAPAADQGSGSDRTEEEDDVQAVPALVGLWDSGAGEHATSGPFSARRQLLVGAAVTAVLAAGASGVLALRPGVEPVAGTNVVTKIETRTVTAAAPEQVMVPWAPGVTPPSTSDSDPSSAEAAPGGPVAGAPVARQLPGAPTAITRGWPAAVIGGGGAMAPVRPTGTGTGAPGTAAPGSGTGATTVPTSEPDPDPTTPPATATTPPSDPDPTTTPSDPEPTTPPATTTPSEPDPTTPPATTTPSEPDPTTPPATTPPSEPDPTTPPATTTPSDPDPTTPPATTTPSEPDPTTPQATTTPPEPDPTPPPDP